MPIIIQGNVARISPAYGIGDSTDGKIISWEGVTFCCPYADIFGWEGDDTMIITAGAAARFGLLEQNGHTPEFAAGAIQASRIRETCDEIRDLLLSKNIRYGNSAGDPVRVFSKGDAVEGLRVRIDDKLSRLARGAGIADDEDTLLDLAGYLVLLLIETRKAKV